MGDGHERFEAMAVGHVLGGLPAGESSDFRTHLVACRDCRLRVAELRDIASDLAAAEREERALARLKTKVARRADPDEDLVRSWSWDWRWSLAVVAATVLMAGLLMWNLHLRSVQAEMLQTGSVREDTLSSLGTGTLVPVEVSGDAAGVVAVDGDRVALSVTGLPPIEGDRRVVIWLLDGSGDTRESIIALAPGQPSAAPGQVALTVPLVEAAELQITVESLVDGELGMRPVGRWLVRADLSAAHSRSARSSSK